MRTILRMFPVVLACLSISFAGCCKPSPCDKPQVSPVPAAKAKLAIRINAGAEKDYTDTKGVLWSADPEYTAQSKAGFLGGQTVLREELKIEGTASPGIYQSERYSMDGYRFDLPAGKYTVRLHFAETYEGIEAAEQRVFSVKINGNRVLKDLDVLKAAGGFAKPLVKEFKDVEPKEGKILIEFESNVQNPQINALEILGQ